MKNNRAKINDRETTVLLSQIGDPALFPVVEDLGTEGVKAIVLLDISNVKHLKVYNQLHNSPDDFEVVDEVEHAGRYTVFVTIRYIRKGTCDIELPEHAKDSRVRTKKTGRRKKSAAKPEKDKTKTPEIGFGSQKVSPP